MRVVKKIIIAASLSLAALLALAAGAGPSGTRPAPTPVPAQADLAEAVFTMLVARASEAGLPPPTTLCEACTAAHLGLATDVVRERCRKACGLR